MGVAFIEDHRKALQLATTAKGSRQRRFMPSHHTDPHANGLDYRLDSGSHGISGWPWDEVGGEFERGRFQLLQEAPNLRSAEWNRELSIRLAIC